MDVCAVSSLGLLEAVMSIHTQIFFQDVCFHLSLANTYNIIRNHAWSLLIVSYSVFILSGLSSICLNYSAPLFPHRNALVPMPDVFTDLILPLFVSIRNLLMESWGVVRFLKYVIVSS